MVNITSGQQNENSVVHIQDIPEQLRSEAVSQIIYNIIKQDPSLSQGNTVLLSQAYNVIHSINYEKYMSGLLSKDRNVVSLMVIEITNALETLGIVVDKDIITIQFIWWKE